MKKQLLILYIICSICFNACMKEATSVEDIITRVENAYTSMTSYRDTGIVTTNYISTKPVTAIKYFRTAYANDGRFRFEFNESLDGENSFIIHQDINKAVTSWWGISSQVMEEDNLVEAVIAAGGSSDMTTFIIPPLFFPVEFESYNIFRSLTGLVVENTDVVDGKVCLVISGYNMQNDICKIYVQNDNYLIRRYADGHQYETFDFTRIVDYYPEVNAVIPDVDLLINVP
jgi:hypothetical protein